MLCAAAPALAQRQPITDEERFRLGTTPVEPFRVIGNIYYVGAVRVSSFLIKTSEGYILMDTGFPETAPGVRDNLEKLGIRPGDIKLLLSSHAHRDHVGGHALIKELTGAKVLSSERDAPLIASGGIPGGPKVVTVDEIIRDRQQITLGDVTLTAHLTPGHTPGCTTWTMTTEENGRKYNVVFMGSVNVNEYRLTGDPNYPNRAEDFRNSIARLKEIPGEVFLGPHGFFFNFLEKMERLKSGGTPNVWVDPQGYREYIAAQEKVFQERLQQERGGR
jgi:metallo-beta-lactamase class B